MKQLEKELEDYFKIADTLPDAPDVSTFLDDPFKYNYQSPCLSNPVDNENNTPLISAVKNSGDK